MANGAVVAHRPLHHNARPHPSVLCARIVTAITACAVNEILEIIYFDTVATREGWAHLAKTFLGHTITSRRELCGKMALRHGKCRACWVGKTRRGLAVSRRTKRSPMVAPGGTSSVSSLTYGTTQRSSLRARRSLGRRDRLRRIGEDGRGRDVRRREFEAMASALQIR
jgi:hypothetical protein